ncbi:NAD(P)H-hydrate dehydratase [Persicobacter psychrovividus]|uniref:Bifunctional NAD(P)H-hydrate repair enzyme n=1 Tax=Persicobacter psychrovividus TaxID=387638 RepID=A0ABM7VAW3_9BACT|nr:bifunctional NAD(P)H-hydrate repair enzyme [Persicobacter psychrovividus]
MRILSPEQIHAADRFTIENEPITSEKLMFRAAKTFSKWFRNHAPNRPKSLILCGVGNNGGDGIVIAKLLAQKGYPVEVAVVRFSPKSSRDFNHYFHQYSSLFPVHEVETVEDLPPLDQYKILIDGIFGVGLNRPIEGFSAEIIHKINHSGKEIIAIDIASGLYAERASSKEQAIIRPSHTISFQVGKLAFYLPENHDFVGDLHILDIGLDQEFIQSLHAPFAESNLEDIRQMLMPRDKYDHKGSYGHALIIAGSYGMAGACALSAKAALRSGAGLVSVQCPTRCVEVLQVAIPEAMVIPDEVGHKHFAKPTLTGQFDAVAVGPGIGTHEMTQEALANLFATHEGPLVLDADALNIISQSPALLKNIPRGSVLTPHPKEFERLVGKTSNQFERLENLQALAVEHQIICLIKGANTAIGLPDGRVYFNPTGNPGMATGGSGDVLTGIITALMAQGYHAEEAAIVGVYVHGLAGDYAAEALGMTSLIASDIIAHLPKAFQKIDHNLW